MARVSLSEYQAKKLLVADYQGAMLRLDSLDDDIRQLDAATDYILKVDQGIKKRGKQGLIRLNVAVADMKVAVKSLAKKGFERFLAEPMVPHDDADEQYLSLERVRGGIQIMHSTFGGVEVESRADAIRSYTKPDDVPLPAGLIDHIIEVMDREQLSFVEINPLLVHGDQAILLDAAVLADSAGIWQATWSDDDIVAPHRLSGPEKLVAELNDGSPAAFSLRVLNPDGAVWLLLSGGGASITIADEAANRGKAELIGNYGEYSGGPTREETQLYTEAVLQQVFMSKAPHKGLVIAGGVANFTDVKKTFAGIIDAFTKNLDQLQQAGIKVFVRRGGPNEAEGLAQMELFLKTNGLFGSVYGSDVVLTKVIEEVLEFVDA